MAVRWHHEAGYVPPRFDVDASRLLEELGAMPCPLCPHLIARHSLAGECADCDCHGCVSVAFVEPDDVPAAVDIETHDTRLEWPPYNRRG